MNVRIAARGVAIAVAVAAAIDPTWTTARPERGRLGILVDASPTMSLPASTSGPDTRGQQALAIRDEVVAALADDADIEPYLSPGQDAVLVIGDALRPLPGSTPPVPVWTVTVGSTLSPNVEVESVALPHRVALGSRVLVEVTIRGVGVAGETTTVTLTAGALAVASRAHTWQPGTSRVSLAFEVVPWATGPLALRATALPGAREATNLDNAVDATTYVGRRPARVLVLDAHPSWTTRFVSLALAGDPEVQLTSRTHLGRSVQVQSGGSVPVALTPQALEEFDVVVVSSLDAESTAAVRWLDTFLRRRGGTVLLLADDVAGLEATRRWWTASFRERTTDAPTAITLDAGRALRWHAATFADATGLPPTARVFARSSDARPRPVVVAQPVGAGRLVVSLALDAWRYRGVDEGAFAQVFRSLTIWLARQASPEFDVRVMPGAGRDASSTIEARDYREPPDGRPRRLPVAQFRHGDADRAVELWPTAAVGGYRAHLDAFPGADLGLVTFGRDDAAAAAAIGVASGARPALHPALPLEWLALAHGGTPARPAELTALTASLRAHLDAARQRENVTFGPMRSPWWLVPFALALGLEWGLRRRSGLR
jgi:hypothetical protein